jgi:hypothetical protein
MTEVRLAGLVCGGRAGRSLIYAADFAAMGGLVAYLTENCCGGRCPAPSRRATACKETTT